MKEMGKTVLEIKNLQKSYGDLEVLQWVDLSVEDGDFFALLGHNGAGKSTTIGIMTKSGEYQYMMIEYFLNF